MGNRSSANVEDDGDDSNKDLSDNDQNEYEDWWEDHEEGDSDHSDGKAAVPKIEVETMKKQQPVQKKQAKIDAYAIAALRAKAAAPKKAKAQAKAASEKKTAPMATAEQPRASETGTSLPPGGEGAIWEALADCIVRQDRDVKSAKQGAVQKGERCTQTGPWKADPSGRVRMPVKTSRGASGWITLDEQRCRNVNGEYGETYLQMVSFLESQEADAAEEPSVGQKDKKTAEREEIDDLLDMFGGDDVDISAAGVAPMNTGESKNDEDNSEDEDERIAELIAMYVDGSEPASKPELVAAASSSPAIERVAEVAEPAGTAEPKSELTDAQKALRACKKKIRDLEGLEAKAKAAGGVEALTPAQQEKLGRIGELRAQARQLTKAVSNEERSMKGEAPAPPRKRRGGKKGGSSTPGRTEEKSSGKGRSGTCTILLAFSMAAIGIAGIYVSR